MFYILLSIVILILQIFKTVQFKQVFFQLQLVSANIKWFFSGCQISQYTFYNLVFFIFY